jgi:hypothetical protein
MELPPINMLRQVSLARRLPVTSDCCMCTAGCGGERCDQEEYEEDGLVLHEFLLASSRDFGHQS